MLAHLARNHVQNHQHSDDEEIRGMRSLAHAPARAALTATTLTLTLTRARAYARSLAPGLLGLVVGCATPAVSSAHASRELVMSYDDNHAKDVIAFPTVTYETVTRFDLPAGEHHPLRLRFQAAAAGALAISLYESTPLESPGDAIVTVNRSLEADDVSNGKDGRWVVEDLIASKPLKGVIWVGVRKSSGQPTLWSSGSTSGQSFIRNSDPQNLMDLLPTKRGPMLRLELAP
jgi:hypothetical protein